MARNGLGIFTNRDHRNGQSEPKPQDGSNTHTTRFYICQHSCDPGGAAGGIDRVGIVGAEIQALLFRLQGHL